MLFLASPFPQNARRRLSAFRILQPPFVKFELREHGTHLFGNTGEFDGRCGINLEIRNQWLYHGGNLKLIIRYFTKLNR